MNDTLRLITCPVIREVLNLRKLSVKQLAFDCGISTGYVQLMLMRHRKAPEHIHIRMIKVLEPITEEELELAQTLSLIRNLYNERLADYTKETKSSSQIRPWNTRNL